MQKSRISNQICTRQSEIPLLNGCKLHVQNCNFEMFQSRQNVTAKSIWNHVNVVLTNNYIYIRSNHKIIHIRIEYFPPNWPPFAADATFKISQLVRLYFTCQIMPILWKSETLRRFPCVYAYIQSFSFIPASLPDPNLQIEELVYNSMELALYLDKWRDR